MSDRAPLTPTEIASRREERREAALLVLFALPLFIALLFVVLVCFRLFSIPAGSMAPALPAGSTVLVSRLSYGFTRHTFDWFTLNASERWPRGDIRRGDIVVFRTSQDRRTVFVKRIVGLGGDRVAVKAGRLILNGETVQRAEAGNVPDPWNDQRTVASYIETLPGGPRYTIVEALGDMGEYDNTGEFTVPSGALFVMGDNRDNSVDSRDMSPNGVGFVQIDNVVGKVVLTF